MEVRPGRVVKGLAVGAVRVGRVVPKVVVDARIEAEAILAKAKAEAAAIVAGAEAGARAAGAEAAKEAKATEEARLAAAFLAVRAREEARAESDLDRTIALAKMIAERIVGAAVASDPEIVVAIAKKALAEARGARRATIVAHADDVPLLVRDLAGLGFPEGTVNVSASPPENALARGELLLHTDLGTLDARIVPQLERLGRALRDALRRA